MSLGIGAYKVGGARQCSSTRKQVSMATLWAAPTRHHHAETLGGILIDQYLPSPDLQKERKGWEEQTQHC